MVQLPAARICLRLAEPTRVRVKLSFKMNCELSEIRLACCFNRPRYCIGNLLDYAVSILKCKKCNGKLSNNSAYGARYASRVKKSNWFFFSTICNLRVKFFTSEDKVSLIYVLIKFNLSSTWKSNKVIFAHFRGLFPFHKRLLH